MGTLVAVKKEGQICIGSNSINLREPWLRGELHMTPHCIVKVGESYVGLASSVAYQQAFEHTVAALNPRRIPSLSSRQEVFGFFSSLHETLRNTTGMNVSYQANQEFEWSPMNAIVANRSGLYRVDSSRGVYEFNSYWAYGSGESFALGSMYALYSQAHTAQEIVHKALEAASNFDSVATGQIVSFVIKSPTLVMTSHSFESPKPRREKNKTLKLPQRSKND